jgi:hypothetical protein
MRPLLTCAVTRRVLRITARSRIALVLAIACMAALLGGCGGEESPEASSPSSSASTSSTTSVAPSPQKIVRSREKIAPTLSMPTLRPTQCVAAPPSTRPTPMLDNDVCQAIVGYTRDWTVVKAKVDPTPLSQAGTRLHGWFDSPSSTSGGDTGRFWSWKALFPLDVQESHQIFVFNPYSGLYGCGPQGMGRGVVPTATVDRERGIIKVVIPSPCINEQGVPIAPRSIRASVNVDSIGSPDDGGVEMAYFTDPLFPGDVAVLRR